MVGFFYFNKTMACACFTVKVLTLVLQSLKFLRNYTALYQLKIKSSRKRIENKKTRITSGLLCMIRNFLCFSVEICICIGRYFFTFFFRSFFFSFSLRKAFFD